MTEYFNIPDLLPAIFEDISESEVQNGLAYIKNILNPESEFAAYLKQNTCDFMLFQTLDQLGAYNDPDTIKHVVLLSCKISTEKSGRRRSSVCWSARLYTKNTEGDLEFSKVF